LDRGATGCLLLSFAKSDDGDGNATAILQDVMQSSTTSKTYLAMVRGEGILHGRDFRNEGWFDVDRPLKDESGNLKNATTYLRFIAGQDNGNGTMNDRPRVSLVLARIKTGRWHQIRKHLNGISHPIIGDSTHGNSKTNQEWREKWGLQPERTCLHLLQLKIPSTSVTPSGIYIVSSLPSDMEKMIRQHLEPETLRRAENALEEEGLSLKTPNASIEIPIRVKIREN
jgi:23S rRNA-/tRNA-specific pseudouridylate synthase